MADNTCMIEFKDGCVNDWAIDRILRLKIYLDNKSNNFLSPNGKYKNQENKRTAKF